MFSCTKVSILPNAIQISPHLATEATDHSNQKTFAKISAFKKKIKKIQLTANKFACFSNENKGVQSQTTTYTTCRILNTAVLILKRRILLFLLSSHRVPIYNIWAVLDKF